METTGSERLRDLGTTLENRNVSRLCQLHRTMRNTSPVFQRAVQNILMSCNGGEQILDWEWALSFHLNTMRSPGPFRTLFRDNSLLMNQFK